jgi:hypothetical protein
MSATSSGPTHQLVAVYDTFDAARRARDRLLAMGLSDGQVEIRAADPGRTDPGYGPADDGFWDAIRLFLVPGDEGDYGEAVRRGHLMLLVRPQPDQRDKALEILHQTEPVDLDALLADWRAGPSSAGSPPSGVATKTASGVPPSEGGADVAGVQTGPADPLASAGARRQSIGRVRSYALDPPGTYAVPRMSGAPEEGGAGRSDSGGTG